MKLTRVQILRLLSEYQRDIKQVIWPAFSLAFIFLRSFFITSQEQKHILIQQKCYFTLYHISDFLMKYMYNTPKISKFQTNGIEQSSTISSYL